MLDKSAELCIIMSVPSESGGTGRRARLRGVWFTPYGFKSRFPHQYPKRVIQAKKTVFMRVFAKYDLLFFVVFLGYFKQKL